MPFGFMTRDDNDGDKASPPPSAERMHPSDLEILAAINGTASSSSSSSSHRRGPLSRSSSFASSSSVGSSLASMYGDSASCASSTTTSSSTSNSMYSDSSSVDSRRGRRRASFGKRNGLASKLRSNISSLLRMTKRRDRKQKLALGGMAALALAVALSRLSSSGGMGSFNDEGRVLARGAVPPPLANGLVDLSDSTVEYDHILPVFWHVLKSGGTAVQDLSVSCLGLTAASEVGGMSQQEEELRVVEVNEGQRHVNVDATTTAGIERAGRLGLAPSGLADVLFTPLLLETAEFVLSPQHPGRMFALFRHPVRRAVSQFYYLQSATWEPTYNPSFQQMTLEEYSRSDLVESDWMVRSLVGKMEGPLHADDVEAAKEVLRKKCLVGLVDNMKESVERFRTYFGWGYDDATAVQEVVPDPASDNPDAGEQPQGEVSNPQVDQCVSQYLNDPSRGNRSGRSLPIQEGDATWEALVRKNRADAMLYEYAQQLFEEQRDVVAEMAEERARRRSEARKEKEGQEGQMAPVAAAAVEIATEDPADPEAAAAEEGANAGQAASAGIEGDEAISPSTAAEPVGEVALSAEGQAETVDAAATTEVEAGVERAPPASSEAGGIDAEVKA